MNTETPTVAMRQVAFLDRRDGKGHGRGKECFEAPAVTGATDGRDSGDGVGL